MKRMKKQNYILMGLMVCGVLAGCEQQTETEVPPPKEQSFEENVKEAASEFNESAQTAADEIGEDMKAFGGDIAEGSKKAADEIGEDMKAFGGCINEGSKKAAQKMKELGGNASGAFGNAMDETGE